MRVLITGAHGQLGRALIATAPADAVLDATDATELDITDAPAVERRINATKPQLVINAAAYTLVDQAESDEVEALRINGDAVGVLAAASRAIGARFVHVSTDFVFDGGQSTPYAPDAATNPLNAYGRTKLAGEQAAGTDALIVRTAWVYAAQGHNFVRSMLRAMAERERLRVVIDQVGTPTYARGLAEALWALSARQVQGIFHYTDSGCASWYDFAVAIQEEALARGLLSREIPIDPIATADYPTAATRPPYSVLDKRATVALIGAAPHWRVQLRRMIEELHG
ncbi:MAG: NAD(P)-dependent oxidoreductase [Proteobacteria bacterium SG_bin6]|nr:MAG: NAD(P)-dependent oxidoreductase [Proteobacteria bacterium SG_bin6]